MQSTLQPAVGMFPTRERAATTTHPILKPAKCHWALLTGCAYDINRPIRAANTTP